MKLIQHLFFKKMLPNFEFKVNFSIQLYALLTHEDPVYLRNTYDYVYYLKCTELRSFFGHRVWFPKPVHPLLNLSGNREMGLYGEMKENRWCEVPF